MIWPFKRKSPEAPPAVHLPMPPCGDLAAHIRWEGEEGLGLGCPRCARIKVDAEKLAAEDRLARKIADAVVREMSKPTANATVDTSKTVVVPLSIHGPPVSFPPWPSFPFQTDPDGSLVFKWEQCFDDGVRYHLRPNPDSSWNPPPALNPDTKKGLYYRPWD